MSVLTCKLGQLDPITTGRVVGIGESKKQNIPATIGQDVGYTQVTTCVTGGTEGDESSTLT